MTSKALGFFASKVWVKTFIALSVAILITLLNNAVSVNAAADDNYADFVFTHGKGYTLNSAAPWQQAVAIKGNKIIYVGDDTRDIASIWAAAIPATNAASQ